MKGLMKVPKRLNSRHFLLHCSCSLSLICTQSATHSKPGLVRRRKSQRKTADTQKADSEREGDGKVRKKIAPNVGNICITCMPKKSIYLNRERKRGESERE